MEYKIISAGFTSQLEIEVNRLLPEGWEPFGNMAVSTYYEMAGTSYPEFHQPMIRRFPKIKANVRKTIPAFETIS